MLDIDQLLIRRSNAIALGVPDRRLRRATQTGTLTPVVPGVFAETAAWRALEPIEQHKLRVLATVERMRGSGMVFSHHAAAALWGIRMLGSWPRHIDVTLERASGGRSSGLIRRHCTGLEDLDVVDLDGLTVTSPAQTVADLGLILPFADAVVAMVSARHRKRRPQPLVTEDQLHERIALLRGRRGWTPAQAAAAFSTHLSDSPEESHSRVAIHLLGFPEPLLQHRFSDGHGFVADTDFFWFDFDHAGEFDGGVKYREARILAGRSPEQALLDEKDREDELRRHVRTLSRWRTRHLYPHAGLFRILSRAGLPSSGSRRPY